MRFITNKRLIDRIKIEDLLKITKLNPAMSIIKSKSLKLFGHIKRSESGSRYSRLCQEGMVEGKRNQGRQLKRWRDNIYAWSNLDLTELNTVSKDGERWKVLPGYLILHYYLQIDVYEINYHLNYKNGSQYLTTFENKNKFL